MGKFVFQPLVLVTEWLYVKLYIDCQLNVVKNILTLLFLMTFADSRLFILDSRLFTLDSRHFTLDSRLFTLDSRLLLSTLDFYSRLSTFTLDSRPILSTLDPRLLDTLILEWVQWVILTDLKNMASKISILKDIYLENRFIYNKLEAILFEEMRRIGLLREIGKYTANLL